MADDITFPFISKDDIASAREVVEEETGLSKRELVEVDSIFDPLMESTGQRFKTAEALFAHLDTDEGMLFATTGRAVLTADDLETASYILKTIWEVRLEHGDAIALEVAEDLARGPDASPFVAASDVS